MKLQRSCVLVLVLLLSAGLIGCADKPGPVVDEEKPVAGQPEPTGKEPKLATVDAAKEDTASELTADRSAAKRSIESHENGKVARREERQADENASEATRQKERADREYHRAEWLLYANQIASAQREWETGNVLDGADLQAGVGQLLGRAAAGDELDTGLTEPLCKLDQSGLVGNR